ncbi:MAG: hypothetical protein HYU36_08160 [Planctomycetes bacterium]|nr:hypothetical protein [Planctomycetota bacterium]
MDEPRHSFRIAWMGLYLCCIFFVGEFHATAAPSWAKEFPPDPPVPLSLPIDLEAAKKEWKIVGEPKVIEDEILKRKVFMVPLYQGFYPRSLASFSGSYAAEMLVRLSDPKQGYGGASLRVGVRDKNGAASPAYSISIGRYYERGYILTPALGESTLWTQPHRLPGERKTSWSVWDPLYGMERFPPDKISPLWDEDFRIGVENGMAKVPKVHERWHRVRIEVRDGRARCYHGGMLVADEENRVQADGAVQLDLSGEARVASLVLQPLVDRPSAYYPVPLDDILNARGPVDPATLPAAGREASVAGVPFLFPPRSDQADHVDVGQSFFRYGLGQGYGDADPMTTWPTVTVLDPAMIRLRVPNQAYQRLWILAASDGEPNSTPVMTVRFYRGYKGWPLDAATRVPEFTAKSSPKEALQMPIETVDGGDRIHLKPRPVFEPERLKVRMTDGSAGSLWLVPIELDAGALASDFREEPALCIELTKEVKDYRAFPDPMFYGSYPAGLPSAVRVYALTLERAPVSVISSGTRHGKVYPSPEQPVWAVDLKSQSASDTVATLRVECVSPGGRRQTFIEGVHVPAGQKARLEFLPELPEFGLYAVRTTVTTGKDAQARNGTFLRLPPDTRVTNEHNSRWGLWCWGGGHETESDPDNNMQILRALGSRIGGQFEYEKRQKWGIGPTASLCSNLYFDLPEWSKKEPYDPAEYEKFKETFSKEIEDRIKKDPGIEYFSVFAEHMISLPITHNMPPEMFGKPWHEYTEAEKVSIRAHFISAKAAFEACRKAAPKAKFLFGHCGPLFSLPFMRMGYDKQLFDGYGVDSPQFERMPERPPRSVEANIMYFLKEDMKRLGYDKELVHVESYYPSSHPLALGFRRSADSVVRTAVLSLALGSDRFFACWTTHDCEGYWGSQHYGCIGMISRKPEYNPKPAAAAFATLTQMLDTALYDGWLPTGSRTAYCVRFKDSDKWIYSLWTLRGTRPITLHAPANCKLVRVDENGNSTPMALVEGRATVTLSETAFWVVARGAPIEKAEVGAPDYSAESLIARSSGEAIASPRGPAARYLLEDFEAREWSTSAERDVRYDTNCWDVVRTPGPFQFERVHSPERQSRVVRVTLTERPGGKPFVSWYGSTAPARPLPIPGKARALSVRAKGNSGWGRIVYVVQDAKGEVFQSVGTKDDWNCDDVHSWSYFNFDGWRTMEFPLPANSPGDDYREMDSVWWNHSEEGIVDLPLQLVRIFIEMQTHQIYVDEMLPVENLTIELDDLEAVYDDPEDMTEKPVLVQRSAAGTLKARATGGSLPNPIAGLREAGVGAATEILKAYRPEREYDGTRIHLSLRPVEGVKEYQVWVSAYEDGRGAVAHLKTKETEPLVTGLKPNVPLYFFVTYTDAQDKPSKPSAVRRTVLKDEFPMK